MQRRPAHQESQDMNTAIIAKLGRELLLELENIWMEVLTSKYLTIDDFLDVKKMANPSRIWKYILHHSNLKKKLLDIRKWKEYQLLVKQMDERLPSNSINPGD